jgi:Ribbon-helix-helix protein, copG family
MARVLKRVAAKRDLTDHFVFLGENASVDVARRFLHACNAPATRKVRTKSRATLNFVEQNRNITLSLPRDLLRQIKRLAADRDTSVSAMMIEALTRLADEDRHYSAARKRALAALRTARSLGTGGHRIWSRDELHER